MRYAILPASIQLYGNLENINDLNNQNESLSSDQKHSYFKFYEYMEIFLTERMHPTLNLLVTPVD